MSPHTAARHSLAIRDVHARMRARVKGTVVAITYRASNTHPQLLVVLADASGRINLVFMGRRYITGIEPGRHMVAAGTVMRGADGLQMMNPAYRLLPERPAQ